MMGARRRLWRVVVLVLIGMVPTLLLALGVTQFMLNHLFFRAPYLLDSGMLSGLAYRDGLLLPVPAIACSYAEVFYDVYVSPLISLFSVLSYVAPVGRLEWFALVEGAVYAPIGLAVYTVASRLEPATVLRRMPIAVIAALAFSFSGIVFWMIGYPHFEAAMPGLTCLMLGAVVTGRTRIAWLCLALAVSVRQDGGLHVATALAPLLFLRGRGVAMSPIRRRLVAMSAAAVAATVVGMVCQRLFFHSASRLTNVYLGSPLYSHLSAALLVDRARRFLATDQVIYYPFLATCLVAALRRDAQYLLGWAAVAPWFALSFTALDEAKASFFAYGAGPFLVAVFWVYLHGAHLAPIDRRLRAGALEVVFTLVCLASTLGVHRAAPVSLRRIAEDMAIRHHRNRAAVARFSEALRDHRARLGRLQVDDAVATLALEHVEPKDSWIPGTTGVDTLAFHRDTADAVAILPGLIANHLDHCAHVHETGIYVCSRTRLPADTFAGVALDEMPAAFLFTNLGRWALKDIAAEERGVVFRTAGALTGSFESLPRGSYEWTLHLATDEPVALVGDELARVEITQGESLLASATAGRQQPELAVRFEANGAAPGTRFLVESRAGTPLIVTRTELRAVAVKTPAAP